MAGPGVCLIGWHLRSQVVKPVGLYSTSEPVRNALEVSRIDGKGFVKLCVEETLAPRGHQAEVDDFRFEPPAVQLLVDPTGSS